MLIIGGNSARVGGADMCCMALLLFVFVGRRAELDRFRLGAWVVILLSCGSPPIGALSVWWKFFGVSTFN
ncbi:hypothetical protein ACW9HJ_23260 [Nocardia gipuzkoensis]